MIEILKTLILDFQELKLRTGVPRRIAIQAPRGKATICSGVRKCGKSTCLFQIIDKLLKTGVSPKNILYINFFDERLHNLQHKGPSDVLEAYYSLYPEKKNSETVYCFFDGILIIPDWESFIDRILRMEKMQVYLTGSSAHMLSNEIATRMQGRSRSKEIFPLSFQEFLDFKNINLKALPATKKRLLIKKAFEEYWDSGSFPEVLNIEKQLRVKIHQEYFNAILFRDLVERYGASHPKAISDLAHFVIDNIASSFSINKLTQYLQSLGHKISKTAVSNCLLWFEDAYFFFTVRLFDASIRRANINPKKIYCIDHALASSISSGILTNHGHLLENLVYITLRRYSPTIFYYKTHSEREVDFLVQKHDRSRLLVQVCDSLQNEKTKQRELTALSEAMSELKLSSGIIVSREDEESIKTENGVIEIIPAWKFLLMHDAN